MRLSIVIPTLNEERVIASTLRCVAEAAPDAEVIVVDGGSTDSTHQAVAACDRPSLRLIISERGRGTQMNSGAHAATGDVVLFLHADTTLPVGAAEMIGRAVEDQHTIGGNFLMQFVPRSVVSDLFSRFYNLRSRLSVYYGDSAIFVRKDTFLRIGGFRNARIMEDLDLVQRLRAEGRLTTIREGSVRSSARRFAGPVGAIRALLIWSWLHILYYCGARQESLDRRYPPVR